VSNLVAAGASRTEASVLGAVTVEDGRGSRGGCRNAAGSMPGPVATGPCTGLHLALNGATSCFRDAMSRLCGSSRASPNDIALPVGEAPSRRTAVSEGEPEVAMCSQQSGPGPSPGSSSSCEESCKPPPKNCYRLVLLGSSRVGKTSIVARYLLTNYVERSIFEKFIDPRKSKGIPEFYATRNFINVSTRAHHGSLSSGRRIQSTNSHHISLKPVLNIILPATSRSSKLCLAFRFTHQLAFFCIAITDNNYPSQLV
jgi:hypothetical protein